MPTEWLLQVCKTNSSLKSIKPNGSIKSNKYGRLWFVRKWNLLKTNSANQLSKTREIVRIYGTQ